MEALVILLAAGFLGGVYLSRRREASGTPSGDQPGGVRGSNGEEQSPGVGTPTAGAAAAQANAAAQAAAATANSKAAASDAVAAQAAAAAAAAETARLGQFATLEQRAREANEARERAEAALRESQAAAAAAESARRDAAEASRRAADVLRERAPVLGAKQAELNAANQRIAFLRSAIETLARQRRALADAIVRYPEVLRYVYDGPDNLTLRPYDGPVTTVDYGTREWLVVFGERTNAQAMGRPDPRPNVRIVETAEVETRTRWRAAADEINRSLQQIAADENAAARLTGEVNALATEVHDAEAALGVGAPTRNVPVAGGVAFSGIAITTAHGTAAGSGAPGARRRANIRGAN